MGKMMPKHEFSWCMICGSSNMIVESKGNTLDVISPHAAADVCDGMKGFNDQLIGAFRNSISLQMLCNGQLGFGTYMTHEMLP